HVRLFPLSLSFTCSRHPRYLHSFPTRRSSDLWSYAVTNTIWQQPLTCRATSRPVSPGIWMSRKRTSGACASTSRRVAMPSPDVRSEEHTSELQSRFDLVCRLLLEKKKNHT